MSGPNYLLDTNIIISFLKGLDWAVSFLNTLSKGNAVFYVSSVTRMELLSFPGITKNEEDRITQLLSFFRVVSITEQVENLAIQVRRDNGMKLPDAIIAATSEAIDATLVSADTDFLKISDLRLINPRDE